MAESNRFRQSSNGGDSDGFRQSSNGGDSYGFCQSWDGWELLNKKRKQQDMSVAVLCREAGIDPSTWHAWRLGKHVPRPATIRQIRLALTRQANGSRVRNQLIWMMLRYAMRRIAEHRAWDADKILQQTFGVERPANPLWLQASEARRLAVTILIVELAQSRARVAEGIGCTRQSIHQALAYGEHARDDVGTDAMLQNIAEEMMAIMEPAHAA